jgi:hypothetical protein
LIAARQLAAPLVAGIALALAQPVSAQGTVQLSGTYVRYLAISSGGVMLAHDALDGHACTSGCVCDATMTSCLASRSMRYAEDGTDANATCDAFRTGVESFTVIAARSDGAPLRAQNTVDLAQMVPLAGPTLADRSIHWAGTLRDPSGLAALRIDLDWSYADSDRVVRLVTTVTNVSTQPVLELYVLRNANPNFVGVCPSAGGGPAATANDVVRQPPTGSDALVTASAGGFVLGIGAHDDRARGTATGNVNSDAVGEWLTPHDPDGATSDTAIDLVFHEPALAPSDATAFEAFYVWGASLSDVEARFDAAGSGSSTCAGVADGVACSTVSGAVGVCHRSACCTGCWDATGARCMVGTSALRCGSGGRACASCVDGLDCTSDVCALGACSSPPAPVGTACEDGVFCTIHDVCDGAAHCHAGAANTCDDGATCTTDACDEAGRACGHTRMTGCLIGGECVATGAHARATPCLVCDPAREPSDWSATPSGGACGEAYCAAGTRFEGGTCDGAGSCSGAHHAMCATGACRADGSDCEPPCTSTSCPDGQRCDETMRCVSRAALGAACTADGACTSGHCVDRVCCEDVCAGTCAACNVAHTLGRCVAVPRGTDPSAECEGALVCDGAGACMARAASDAGAHDGGAGLDAGAVPPSAARCGCSVPGARSDRGAWLLLVLALLLVPRARAW